MTLPSTDVLITLLAAWLLLGTASLWAWKEKSGLSSRMLWASLRGLLQLLVLAYLLHFLFDIDSRLAQAGVILLFCIVASRISAGHHEHYGHAWLAAGVGLVAACLAVLPWLVWSGAISGESRALIPLASMVVANGMNAVSVMYNRMQDNPDPLKGLHAGLIPNIDTLRVVGLVHMPGIFVGMILAGAAPLEAASAQLVVLYMIVASSFTACIVSSSMLKRLQARNA